MSPQSFSILLACIGASLLGTSPLFVRMSDIDSVATGFYRMLFAMPLLFIWMMMERKSNGPTVFSKKSLSIIILAGIFFAFDLALWNWSIDHTAIVNSTLFNNTAVFFVPLIMWAFYGEKQSVRFITGVTAGLFGVYLMFQESFHISLDHVVGDIVAIASGLMVGLYVIAVKEVRQNMSAGTLMFAISVPCVLGLALLTYLWGESFGPLTLRDGFSIFGQAVLVHTIGQGCLAYSMGRIPASYSALILLLAPVNAAVWGLLFYDESLSLMKTSGMIIIMLSILFVRERKKEEPIPEKYEVIDPITLDQTTPKP